MEEQVYCRMAEIEDEHWWFVVRRRILKTILEGLPLPENPLILEAGCGTGGNLRMLAQFGEVVALEPDPKARAHAAKKGRCRVYDVRLPDRVPFRKASFDLVVALDVLEHLHDDRECLRVLHQSLKHNGWALFTVPAFQFLWSRHDELHHHWRRYSQSELSQKLRAAGFKPVLTTYFNSLLLPVIAGVRIVKKIFHIQAVDDDTMPTPILNRLLTTFFAIECGLLTRLSFPLGVSLLFLARKPES